MKKAIYCVLFITLFISNVFTVNAGSSYPDPEFKNCDETKKDAILKAYKILTNTIDSSPCMSEDIRTKLKKKLTKEITVNCQTSADPDCSGTCAYTEHKITAGIFLCPGAFDSSGCGCLEAVILHELTHTICYPEERTPQECEMSCFPNCAVTESTELSLNNGYTLLWPR